MSCLTYDSPKIVGCSMKDIKQEYIKAINTNNSTYSDDPVLKTNLCHFFNYKNIKT